MPSTDLAGGREATPGGARERSRGRRAKPAAPSDWRARLFLGRAEAAAICGVGVTTFDRWIRDDPTLAAEVVRKDGRVLIPPDALEAMARRLRGQHAEERPESPARRELDPELARRAERARRRAHGSR